MKQSYTVILDWMLELGLSPSELLCYATIFGFCQDGESAYTGSRAYLCRKMAVASKRSADAVLAKLVEKGLIVKVEKFINGVKFCEYRVNLEAVKAVSEPVEISTPGAVPAPAPGAETAPNNKENKVKISPVDIAREELSEDGFSEEFYADVTTLVGEAKWRKKSANAFHLSFRKLHGRPEAEAHEMVRRAIAGGWQGLFELDPRDRAAILNASQPQQQPSYQQGQSRPAAPFKSGVAASEALVQAALSEYNSL